MSAVSEANSENTTKKSRVTPAKELTKIAVLTALMLVSAFFKIPAVPVPVTLQSFVAILAGLTLGMKGVIVPAVYLLLGLCGVPVFANGGGVAYLVQPTCGFTFGFVLAAFLAGAIAGRKKEKRLPRMIAACAVATVALYVCGIAYTLLLKTLYTNEAFDFWKILWGYWIVFIPSDILKAAVAIAVTKILAKALRD